MGLILIGQELLEGFLISKHEGFPRWMHRVRSGHAQFVNTWHRLAAHHRPALPGATPALSGMSAGGGPVLSGGVAGMSRTPSAGLLNNAGLLSMHAR